MDVAAAGGSLPLAPPPVPCLSWRLGQGIPKGRRRTPALPTTRQDRQDLGCFRDVGVLFEEGNPGIIFPRFRVRVYERSFPGVG